MAEKLLYHVEEAAERINLGRSTVYTLIRTGQIESIKVGRKRLIPAAALDDFVTRARVARNLVTSPAGVEA